MIEILAGCAAGAVVLSARRLIDARRLVWMARHPAPTFVFADLVGYTALTERRGDDAAARVAHDFWRAMSVLCREYGARQVKAMGDGAMIWAPDAARAVTLATSAVDRLGTRGDLLPVRVGVHTGSGGDARRGLVRGCRQPRRTLGGSGRAQPGAGQRRHPDRGQDGTQLAGPQPAGARAGRGRPSNRGLGADRELEPAAERGTLRWKDRRLARVLIEQTGKSDV